MSLVLPIALVVITLTRPAGPPGVVVEEVPLPKWSETASLDAGLRDQVDAGQASDAPPR